MTTSKTLSRKEFNAPTKNFETVIPQKGLVTPVVTPTSGKGSCVIFSYEEFANPPVAIPKKYTAITDIVRELERTEQGRVAMEDARKWIGETLHSEEDMTVRSMRLKKGWSQIQLARKLGTSQSHIARIERGSENLYIDTCRRLCDVFKIDMNMLNQALQNQEQNHKKRVNQ